MITRNPSLSDQVTSHIKQLIASDGFTEGRIPPETDLAAELGVSRTTVRDALSRLEHEGAIYRRQGSGTFVNEHGLRIKSRLENIWSYEELLENHGYEPSVRVLDVFELPADLTTVDALGLEANDPILVVKKLFLEDETPVALTVNRIPVANFLSPPPTGDEDIPVYAYLDTHCGKRLAYYLSEIIPVVLEPDQAATLQVDPGTPALSFDEVGYDKNNEPILRATSFFRDDLLRFRLIRKRVGT
jgi:GntR family transcriptional regulator